MLSSSSGDLFQSVKYFEWLDLRFQSPFGYMPDQFQNLFLSARLDWVSMGVL